MGKPNPVQATVITQSSPSNGQTSMQIALFDSSGNPLTAPKKMPFQADTTAVDLAALKVDFNALLTKLKNAGLMATS